MIGDVDDTIHPDADRVVFLPDGAGHRGTIRRSRDEVRHESGVRFPLLADDDPPGAVARAYGVYVPTSGRSRRGLVVLDRDGIVRWSATFPDAVDPGVDGVLSALEAITPTAA